ncbi:TetR/AcrR family transcriptional regulator [Candidatus Poriferisodalis sp.]|uniref:TetR/AcrR family transcriptional regulator n=1 Tax=Candidatus Poriferisodalis sp. TaxID=3101277 RepID=UPI003B0289D8
MSVTDTPLLSADLPLLGADAAFDETELGKRERNKLDKRRRIVAAATELFQEKGFDDTTTAEIASAAGIGAGTLYLYVESKEDLLVSAFLNVAGGAWTEAFERVDPEANVVDQVMALLLHVTKHHNADRRLARSFFKELPFLSETGLAGANTLVSWFLARLAQLFDVASANGHLDPDVPKDRLALNIYAQWQLLMRRLVTDRFSYGQTAAELDQCVRVALWGLTPKT